MTANRNKPFAYLLSLEGFSSAALHMTLNNDAPAVIDYCEKLLCNANLTAFKPGPLNYKLEKDLMELLFSAARMDSGELFCYYLSLDPDLAPDDHCSHYFNTACKSGNSEAIEAMISTPSFTIEGSDIFENISYALNNNDTRFIVSYLNLFSQVELNNKEPLFDRAIYKAVEMRSVKHLSAIILSRPDFDFPEIIKDFVRDYTPDFDFDFDALSHLLGDALAVETLKELDVMESLDLSFSPIYSRPTS